MLASFNNVISCAPLPLVRAVKEAHPNAVVDLLVRPYAAPIGRCAIGVRDVLEWTASCAEEPRGAGKALLEPGQYDAVVLAFPDPAVVRAACAARIPVRIGTGREPLYTYSSLDGTV